MVVAAQARMPDLGRGFAVEPVVAGGSRTWMTSLSRVVVGAR
jgi:hypothetical protein